MNRISTKKIVLNGLMIALVFITTYITRIPGPIPPGYINLGDVVIIVAALILGRNSGFLAGALGSFLADVAFGAFIFAPATLIIKGLEGFIIGAIAHSGKEQKSNELSKIIAIIAGVIIMIAGYFIVELYVLRLFDNTFGYAAAISDLPLNLVQGIASAVIGYILVKLLERVNIKRYILRND